MKNINIWIFLVIFFSVVFRITLSLFINSESGGDTFEFLLIAEKILNFDNPFLEVKRLPLFPIFLIPSLLLNIDGLIWSRVLNALFCGVSVYILYLMVKKADMTKLNIILVLVLFTTAQAYLFFSLRPLSYALYTTLFLWSLYFTLRGSYTSAAISSGLLSMTRHEGFLVAAIIFGYLAFTVPYKEWIKKLVAPLVVYLIIALPFFVSNFFNHNNLFYLGYLDDGGGLYQPQNFGQFVSNLSKIGQAVYTTWGNNLLISRRISFVETLFSLAAIFMVIGGVKYFFKFTRDRIFVLLVILSQFFLALWFQPSGRYIQHLSAFLAIFLIMGASSISKKFVPLAITILLTITSIYTVLLKVKEFNHDTIAQRDFTEVIKYIDKTGSTVAMEKDPDFTHSYIALYYLGSDKVKFVDSLSVPQDTEYVLDWRAKPYAKKIN